MPITTLKSKIAKATPEEVQAKLAEIRAKKIQPSTGNTPAPKARGNVDRFLEDFRAVLSKTAGGVKDELDGVLTRKLSGPEGLQKGANIAGKVAGGISDLVFGTTSRAAFHALPEGAQSSIREGAGKAATAIGVPQVMEAYGGFKEAHPQIAQNVENLANIASIIPGEKLLFQGVNTASKVAKKGAGTVAGRLEQNVVKQTSREALDITKPILTKLEQEKALQQGLGKQSALGKIEILPSDQDKRIADTVKNIVSTKNNPIKNMGELSKARKELSKTVRSNLEVNKRGYNEVQLRSMLDQAKERSRVIFGSDKVQESAYDSVIDEMVRNLKANPKNLGGMWDARMAFDEVINEKFPGLLGGEAGDNVRKNAVKDVRQTLNDFIDAEAGVDVGYKDSMRKLTDMFEARDRIASQAVSRVNKNVVTRAVNSIRANPALAGLSVLGIGSLGSIATSPVAITALIGYGTYRTIKGVITSKVLKETLAKGLRLVERGSKDEAALKALSEQLR